MKCMDVTCIPPSGAGSGTHFAIVLGVKIMLFDETPERSLFLRMTLERLGHDIVAEVSNPGALYDEVRKRAPDAIIIDTESPSRDTLEHLCLIADIRPAEDVPKLQEKIEQRRLDLNSSHDHAGIWRYRKKDGSSISVDISTHLMQFEGRRALAVLALDVTERLRMEERIASYLQRLERAMNGTAQAIAGMMDQRDPYTAGHERRVGEIAAAIAAEMGLPEDTQRGLRVAGDLHDIGKIGVPAEILVKPTQLTPIEFALIQEHPEKGHDILKNIDFPWPIAGVAHQHHERIDGSGYPRGLKGDQMVLEARILAVADVLEAMSSHRPYRPGLGIDKALEEIENKAGQYYDANVVAACLRLFRERGYRIPA
ncbi:MAG: HD domain-containing protein [Betaproteobacteria bacterium]|nr:HD domain-containing protein [Betaproteobacteria bacterium]